jgi:adenosylcobyric acid synthase
MMTPQKTLSRVTAAHAATGEPIEAYEIHIGSTEGPDRARAFAILSGEAEGAISRDGRVQGSYLHGLFASDAFRKAYLAQLDIPAADERYRSRVDDALNALADHIGAHLDVEGIFALAR